MNLIGAGDRFLFGSSSRALRPGDEMGLSAAEVAALHRRLEAFLAFSSPFSARWGVRARYRDQMPAVGPLFFPSGRRRLFVALGFHKNGLQLAPLFARVLLSQLWSDGTFFTQWAFSPARFAR
jgi:glycine/D-amino acid oxidase-like deaminating enzyme